MWLASASASVSRLGFDIRQMKNPAGQSQTGLLASSYFYACPGPEGVSPCEMCSRPYSVSLKEGWDRGRVLG